MGLLSRNRTTTDVTVPAQRPAPRWELTSAGERTDLRCTTCQKTFAYGVAAEKADDQAPFFLQAHQPFCLAVSA